MEEIILTANVAAAGSMVDRVAEIAASLDTVWVLLGAMLVFLMQLGFSMVESGFARTKNTANILMKNLVDISSGSVLFWLVGFGIMFSPSIGGFIGTPDFMGYDWWEGDIPPAAFLVFQTMFCATAATIVSGAVAERTKFHAYLIYCICISTVIYPISGHWTWGDGWLAELGFHDFAGSAVVHSVGGWIALAGAAIVGPRIGKYRNGKIYAIPGHSLTIATMGVFLLWLGWFGFNPGSQLAASTGEDALAISTVFLTTNLAAAAGGLSAFIVAWIKYGKPTLSLSLNGVLAGLVGITAGTDLVSPLGALCIGIISGVVMVFAVSFIDTKLKIDDPVGAIAVHGVCGTLGTILVGFFALEDGLFYGAGAGFLGIQCIGAIVTAVWALVMGYIMFKLIDKTIGMRVPKRIEEEGLDIYEHGETAYN
ncbi:MAG: ammonium transporter [Rikenellaceae bacterium]|nr:ammonium transporter [Rikenellaceae bacterium]